MVAPRPAVVGGFVLGALALGIAAVLFFGGSRLFAHTQRGVVFFEGSVAGLEVGAPVTFRGVTVGSVKQIELQPSSSGRARIPVLLEFIPAQVTIDGRRLRPGSIDTEEFVKSGLRAQLNLQSFVTGQLRVDIDFLPGTPAYLEPIDTDGIPQIPALPSDLDRLKASLSELPVRELSQNLLRTMDAVERLANDLDAKMGPLLDSARNTAETGTRALETIQSTVVQLHVELSHTLGEADSLLSDTKHQIDARGTEASHLLQSTDRVARQADVLLSALNSLTEPRSEFRGNLEASLRDLAATSASLRSMARTLDRDPSAVLRGRSGQ